MCRPVGGSHEEACPGGHIGPPLRGGGGVPNQRKIGAKTGPFQRGGTEPAPYRRITGGAQQRAAEVVGPYGKERKPNQPPKPAGAQRSVRARVGEGWAGIGAKAIPKGGPPPRLPVQCLAKRKARG